MSESNRQINQTGSLELFGEQFAHKAFIFEIYDSK